MTFLPEPSTRVAGYDQGVEPGVGRLARLWANRRARATLGWGAPLAVGMVHIALIAPHYFVGSFDDDASYIMAAKALAAGGGLTGQVASGASVVSLYPPGYSALLVPLVWLWPHSFVPLRLFSALCVAALFPLLWVLMGRRKISEPIRAFTLLLLALTPVLATYGTMVMAEAPYLVILLLLLLLVDRWDAQDRVWTWAGIGVVLASAALIWVKLAGAGAIAGLVLYLALRRDGRGRLWRAMLVAGGVGATMVPVVIARLSTGTTVLGSRYSGVLQGYGNGFERIEHLVRVAPGSALNLLGIAIPDTVAPYRPPLPDNAFLQNIAWQIFAIQMVAVMAIGMVWWWRRHHDAVVAVVGIYLLAVAFWPEVNERRVILVIPVLVAWYAVGAAATIRFVERHARARALRWPRPMTLLSGGAVAALTAGILLPQLPRDYLFAPGQDTSHFGGSRYVALLSRLGTPSDVVETDYLNSTAFFTGHRTAWTGFAPSGIEGCNPAGLTADHAGYLLLGDVNHAGVLDNPCLLTTASTSPWAVELLHTSRDNATVFELIGPGTAHQDLTDLTRGAAPTVTHSHDRTVLEWDWNSPRALDQVSVGQARMIGGSTTSVALEVRTSNGTWTEVASSPSAVGDGGAPFLLYTGHTATQATALRVVLTGSSLTGAADVTDVAALGARAPAR